MRSALSCALVLLAFLGGETGGGATASADAKSAVPATMAECARCHTGVVRRFLEHGMARSIGPAGAVPAGTVTNLTSGNRYQVAAGPDGATLTTTFPDGGARRQRVVGRVGAGRFDTSWVTAETDAGGGPIGRLFFAPVESIAGRGLELSPFETHAGAAGPDMPLTEACLTCHTTDDPDRRPGATVFPGNLLGADAFGHLSALSCSACHGDVQAHADIVRRRAPAAADLGVRRLGALPPASSVTCARAATCRAMRASTWSRRGRARARHWPARSRCWFRSALRPTTASSASSSGWRCRPASRARRP